MSRHSNQTGARAVGSGRGGRRRRDGESAYSAPVQSTKHVSPQASDQIDEAPQSTSQQCYQSGYETDRAWEHTNPEAYRVVNDPNLGYSYQFSAPTGNQTYAGPSHNTAVPYTGQYYQATNTYGSGSYHNSNGGLTALQLQTLNDREQSMNKMEVWENEDQRNGSWYGYVKK
ncbi:hypothetical protein SVAN01_08800 [Stagonosporopsis vannaccii]|nr:hypothetical protein SVAN01_08800 [Stagonosporopsis vannaccii]